MYNVYLKQKYEYGVHHISSAVYDMRIGERYAKENDMWFQVPSDL